MIDLLDLRAFVHIAELGSVSAAARALSAPKSSVSRSLGRLEAVLGVALVERSTRNVRLTDAGRLLQPHAQRILGEVDEAAAGGGGVGGGPRGTLRVNAPYAFAIGSLAPMLPGFLQRYPEVDVVLEMEGRPDMPVGDADLLIRVGPLPDSSMAARRLATVELWTCASPAYLAARGTPARVADLADHEIVGSKRKVLWSFRTPDGEAADIDLQARAVLADAALTQPVLVSGGGIGRLPDFMAGEASARGELVRVLPEMRPETTDAHVVFPSHRSLSAKVRVFIDELVVRTATQRATFMHRA